MAPNGQSLPLHRAIYGRTMSGKTFLAKIMAGQARKAGCRLAILDPLSDPGWPAGKSDFQTADREAFRRFIRTNSRRLVIVDESSTALNRYDREDEWPATMGRHLGHLSIFIAQRPQQLSPTIRGMCPKIYVFALPAGDAKLLADEFGRPELVGAASFRVGEFMEVCGFTDTRHGCIDFARKKVTYKKVIKHAA